MAKGNSIIVSAEPRGVFMEGIVSGTPKPGTVMEIKAATAPVSGRFTWQASSKADGAKQLIAVLLGDVLGGKLEVGQTLAWTGATVPTPGDAYVTGTRCFLYAPAAGEDMNMIIEDQAGTASLAIGDLYGVDQTDGTLIPNSSFASPCFTLLEAITIPSADCVGWFKFNGHMINWVLAGASMLAALFA